MVFCFKLAQEDNLPAEALRFNNGTETQSEKARDYDREARSVSLHLEIPRPRSFSRATVVGGLEMKG